MWPVHPTPRPLAPPRSALSKSVQFISLSKLFLAASCVFSSNIALAPLKAYMTEPLPWTLPPSLNTSLYELERTIPAQYRTTNAYDYNETFYTDVFRYTIADPPNTTCLDTLLRIAATPFFGVGMRDAVCRFASTPLTNASTSSFVYCQDIYLAPSRTGSSCIWGTREASGMILYYATIPTFHAGAVIAKLIYRLVLSLYAIVRLYTGYYRHYASLLASLRRLDDVHVVRYVVCIGDPTSVVLSDLYLSVGFVIDLFLSTSTVVTGILRLSQVDDLHQFALGALYLSRLVWMYFFGMRYSTFLIKRWHWEDRVMGLDATVMTAFIFLAAAGVNTLIIRTPLMAFYQWCNSVVAPDPASIDLTLASVLLTLCTASGPLLLATTLTAIKHRCANATAQQVCLSFKQRVLFYLNCGAMKEHRGGSLYRLFALDPRLRRQPLIGLESADCFIDGYDDQNRLCTRLRVSLLAVALDARYLQDATKGARSVLSIAEPYGFCTLADATSDGVAPLETRCRSPWLL